MTSELHWVDLRTGIDNQMKQTVVKKDSYSSDSLEEFCEESDKSKTSSDENFGTDMNNDKSLSQSSSDFSSVHDSTSITSHYSFEIVEETEALQTEDITESIDIRISPRSSTVMSFNCSNNFYSEFSLVANVEVQIPNPNENLEIKNDSNESQDINVMDNDTVNNKEQTEINENLSDIESIDINANDNILVEIKKILVCNPNEERNNCQKSPDVEPNCDSPIEKKTEFGAKKLEITRQEKKTSVSIEKKIAEEIKEMKEREEDLRIMRENFAKEICQKTVNKTSILDIPVANKPEKRTPFTPNCDEKPLINKTAPAKAENAYIKACVFAIKRKDVLVQQDNSENSNKSPCAIIQESPVEREIRIAKEREEELRREREQALKCKLESFNSELSTAETDADSALSICSDSSFDSVSKLAPFFTRTVSPETSNSNGISVYSSSAGSMCSLESLSQRERQNVGSQAAGGFINGSFSSPSPDSTNCRPGFPFASPRITSDKKSKNIDMERFISSKGKEIKFKGESGINTGFATYYEIKPPQVKKGEEMTCKRFVTAAAKIQNELKEMQEREKQFKKERENLKDIKTADNPDENGPPVDETLSNDYGISPGTKMDPLTLTNNVQKKNKKQDNSANPARRRSVLIDEWEQRIQKSTLQP